MDESRLIEDLRAALERLADAVPDLPPTAAALRRLADALPDAPARSLRARPPRRPIAPRAIEPLCWRALADGVWDARRFDRAMLAGGRARRALAAKRTPRAAAVVAPGC